MVKSAGGKRARQGATVVTGMTCSAPIERVWNTLMFYEQIPRRPPLHLRLLLPVPLRAEGPRSAVGDETRCVYEGGHVVKRATRVDRWRTYRFDVVEQNLAINGGIRLVSGEYRLTELPDGATRIELETCYVRSRGPAWLWRAIEAIVCHLFHRHILGAIRQDVESAQARVEAIRSLRPSRPS